MRNPLSQTAVTDDGNRAARRSDKIDVHGQRLQTAVVDAHEGGAGRQCAVELVLGVHFDQHGQAVVPPHAHQRDELRLVERGHDQQDRVGAGGCCLGHLIGVDDEVLAQQRRCDGLPHGREVRERPVEEHRLGQHRQRHGASRFIAARDGDRVVGGSEHAARR